MVIIVLKRSATLKGLPMLSLAKGIWKYGHLILAFKPKGGTVAFVSGRDATGWVAELVRTLFPHWKSLEIR